MTCHAARSTVVRVVEPCRECQAITSVEVATEADALMVARHGMLCPACYEWQERARQAVSEERG